MTLDDALKACPVVAILRGVRPDEVLAIAEALYAEGVRAVEAPLNSPDPFDSIRRLADRFGASMACGAGTVLTQGDVERAAEAGARLVIAPNTDAAVIRRAIALGLDVAPGFATPSEAFQAIAAGARRLKLFPAATYGPGYLRQLRAVLPPDVAVWGVGGIGAGDLAQWWKAGARGFGIGSEIYRAGDTAADVAAKARAIVTAARALPRGA
jgi:2-dehydro-3-deoxyphosphogalactonate aldolase